MGFEPEKFFIGLTDFFSVLLPGALLTFLFRENLRPFLVGDAYHVPDETQAWVAFVFSSYLLGHFIFLMGSLVCDKAYDSIRGATAYKQAELAAGAKPASALAKALAKVFFKQEADHAVAQVIKLKEERLKPLNAESAMNAFQWSKTRLLFEHPQALATVQRFEADSKFFRSLIIVLCILIVKGVAQSQLSLVLVCLPLMVLAFWRYVDQRGKAVNQAYWYILSLEASRPTAKANAGG